MRLLLWPGGNQIESEIRHEADVCVHMCTAEAGCPGTSMLVSALKIHDSFLSDRADLP